MVFEDKSSSETMEICEYFRSFFQDVYVDNVTSFQMDEVYDFPLHFPQIVINGEVVLEYVSRLKTTWSGGPEGLPSALIKKIGKVISPALTYLFNLSLYNGVFRLLGRLHT